MATDHNLVEFDKSKFLKGLRLRQQTGIAGGAPLECRQAGYDRGSNAALGTNKPQSNSFAMHNYRSLIGEGLFGSQSLLKEPCPESERRQPAD